jgi:hypothetical protein
MSWLLLLSFFGQEQLVEGIKAELPPCRAPGDPFLSVSHARRIYADNMLTSAAVASHQTGDFQDSQVSRNRWQRNSKGLG